MPTHHPRIVTTLRGVAVGAVAGLALLAGPVRAQDAPLVLEVHGGVAAPLGSFANGTDPGEGTSAGPSLSVAFVLPGSGRRGTYVGFSQHRFGCEDAGCPAGGRYVATGFDLGWRFRLVRTGPAIPWLRAGAITTRVETGDLGGANAGVSDLGWGFELGAGAYLGTERAVALNPGVRWARVWTELPGGETLSMQYLIAQVAIAFAF